MDAQNLESYRQAERALWAYEGVEPHEYYLDLANPKLRVRVQEVGAGSPVLFIHGGPNSGSTWAPLAARLQDFRCILLDRPGTGLSEPVDYQAPSLRSRLVDMVVSAIDALELPKVDLIVSSFGGFLGLELARIHPERVGRVVQQACPACLPAQKLPPFMRLLSIPFIARLLGKQKPSVAASKTVLRQIGHGASLDADRIPEKFLEWYVALQTYTDTMPNDVGLIQQVLSWRGVRKDYVFDWDQLRHVTAPTAFFWGSEDAFGDIATAQRVVETMPHATLETLPDGGHLPWLDDPDRAANHAREFLLATVHERVMT
jgi:2-hydroxy-6-oxonona-2,4-dienedioate hydrolase